MLLTDKTAMITGAADGLGWCFAQIFAEQGAWAAILDLRGELAAERAAELGSHGHRAVELASDATLEASITNALDDAVAALGAPDVFVNNAGITRDAVMRKMSLDGLRARAVRHPGERAAARADPDRCDRSHGPGGARRWAGSGPRSGGSASPEDVAGAALFLASDLSAYMTGTVLEGTGGRHMLI